MKPHSHQITHIGQDKVELGVFMYQGEPSPYWQTQAAAHWAMQRRGVHKDAVVPPDVQVSKKDSAIASDKINGKIARTRARDDEGLVVWVSEHANELCIGINADRIRIIQHPAGHDRMVNEVYCGEKGWQPSFRCNFGILIISALSRMIDLTYLEDYLMGNGEAAFAPCGMDQVVMHTLDPCETPLFTPLGTGGVGAGGYEFWSQPFDGSVEDLKGRRNGLTDGALLWLFSRAQRAMRRWPLLKIAPLYMNLNFKVKSDETFGGALSQMAKRGGLLDGRASLDTPIKPLQYIVGDKGLEESEAFSPALLVGENIWLQEIMKDGFVLPSLAAHRWIMHASGRTLANLRNAVRKLDYNHIHIALISHWLAPTGIRYLSRNRASLLSWVPRHWLIAAYRAENPKAWLKVASLLDQQEFIHELIQKSDRVLEQYPDAARALPGLIQKLCMAPTHSSLDRCSNPSLDFECINWMFADDAHAGGALSKSSKFWKWSNFLSYARRAQEMAQLEMEHARLLADGEQEWVSALGEIERDGFKIYPVCAASLLPAIGARYLNCMREPAHAKNMADRTRAGTSRLFVIESTSHLKSVLLEIEKNEFGVWNVKEIRRSANQPPVAEARRLGNWVAKEYQKLEGGGAHKTPQEILEASGVRMKIAPKPTNYEKTDAIAKQFESWLMENWGELPLSFDVSSGDGVYLTCAEVSANDGMLAQCVLSATDYLPEAVQITLTKDRDALSGWLTHIDCEPEKMPEVIEALKKGWCAHASVLGCSKGEPVPLEKMQPDGRVPSVAFPESFFIAVS